LSTRISDRSGGPGEKVENPMGGSSLILLILNTTAVYYSSATAVNALIFIVNPLFRYRTNLGLGYSSREGAKAQSF
jgi:hypothetical protein